MHDRFPDLINTMPELGGMLPVKILNVDVFPAPFTPNSPKHSPSFTVNDIPRIAGESLNVLKYHRFRSIATKAKPDVFSLFIVFFTKCASSLTSSSLSS